MKCNFKNPLFNCPGHQNTIAHRLQPIQSRFKLVITITINIRAAPSLHLCCLTMHWLQTPIIIIFILQSLQRLGFFFQRTLETQGNLIKYCCNKDLIAKGQIISKCLFRVFNFFQKTNDNKLHSSKNELISYFLEEFKAWQFSFEIDWPLTLKVLNSMLLEQ